MQTGIAAASIKSVDPAATLSSRCQSDDETGTTRSQHDRSAHADVEHVARICFCASIRASPDGAFDADENVRNRLAHQREERRVISQVDRRLGPKSRTDSCAPWATRSTWQHRLHRLFVADEIVIDEIEVAAIAGS